MASWLKEGITEVEREEADAQVKATVEDILSDIKSRGDEALLEYSQKFDNWKPAKFRLSRDCLLYTSPSPRDKRQSRMPSSA